MATLLTACGGGGSNTDHDNNPPSPSPPAIANISVTSITPLAIEKSNQLATFKIERTNSDASLAINFVIERDNNTTTSYADPQDFTLKYSDGEAVGDTLNLAANQDSRVIAVHPTQDQQHEVIETLVISLTAGDNYHITNGASVELYIADASNHSDNSKVFIGYFTPENDATTVASGVASLVLQGDNEQGTVSYQFNGLGSAQTDQHIHLAPATTIIKDIEPKGNISNYLWDLAPSGPFTRKQQLLDSLFAGNLYINIHSANYPAGEIAATFNYDADIAPPDDGTLLTPAAIKQDVIRFLTQATFGATPTDYQHLMQQINPSGSNRLQVYEAWIEQQMSLPVTRMLNLTDATNNHFQQEIGIAARRDAFWPIAVYANDQLRHRIAFALSEMLVIGDQLAVTRKAHRGVASYWDLLASHAFGDYAQLLEGVSRHPIMGVWLSHLRNPKADAELLTSPDENFAREIMQLFSFGLIHRQANGAIKLDHNNLPQMTYDNRVIKALARVFTGLSFSKISGKDGAVVDNHKFMRGNVVNDEQYRWTQPMKFFVEHHDFGEKVLFHNGDQQITLAATAATVEAADAELTTTIGHIVSHPTTAPYLSRQLIQRLVTSNPSKDYVARVSGVFGQSGDLRQVVKAILLDPEAREPAVSYSKLYGKVKEPLLRFSALMRLLTAYSEIGFNEQGLDYADKSHYHPQATLLRFGNFAIGQQSLAAETVFNFFSPDFAPTGALATRSLVAPELQLMNESLLVNTINTFNTLIYHGRVRKSSHESSWYSKEQLRVRLDFSQLLTLWQQAGQEGDDEQQAKAEAVIDYLDFFLNAGQLQLNKQHHSYQAIRDGVMATTGEQQKILLAIYGIVNAPESIVQR